jgi:hypothetical protein
MIAFVLMSLSVVFTYMFLEQVLKAFLSIVLVYVVVSMAVTTYFIITPFLKKEAKMTKDKAKGLTTRVKSWFTFGKKKVKVEPEAKRTRRGPRMATAQGPEIDPEGTQPN